jgi:hypothetical protein
MKSDVSKAFLYLPRDGTNIAEKRREPKGEFAHFTHDIPRPTSKVARGSKRRPLVLSSHISRIKHARR